MTASPGARWWKVDFHTHTPASSDYGKRSPDQDALKRISPAEWLLGFMRAGIDAVVVTDHNSGRWIDSLKQALAELELGQPAGYRPLTLFPGVEITANGGAHILAVFPPAATGDTITRLLGAVGAQAEFGESDLAATKSPIEVVRAIAEADAIPVLAHVDRENSALRAPGNTRASLFEEPTLNAMEVTRHDWDPPAQYRDSRRKWARVLGSDSHHPNGDGGPCFPGSHFTWVKMERPSHDGLRLALLDGDDVSVRRSDLTPDDQNQHSHLVIESVTVTDARFCGRGTPLVATLSPWLTTVIGGRGTGKSTVVAMLRLAFRREHELPEALAAEFSSFCTVAIGRRGTGALTPSTMVQVVFVSDRQRYRVHWSKGGELAALEEECAGTWVASKGEVRSRFAVRILSQGQIFEMAQDPRALLMLVDDAPEVGRPEWQATWDREELRFLSLRAKLRELKTILRERSALEGTLSDVQRKLILFEESSHAEVLKAYQRVQRQRREIDAWGRALLQQNSLLGIAADHLRPVEIDRSNFDEKSVADRALLEALAGEVGRVRDRAVAVAGLAEDAREQAEAWTSGVQASAWQVESELVEQRYAGLIAELAARGVSDIGQYGGLVQQRRLVEERLRTLDNLTATVAELHEEANASATQLALLRQELTMRRTRFVDEVLRDNPHVRMTIKPYGQTPHGAEASVRDALGLDGERKFADDLVSEDGTQGRLATLYRELPTEAPVRTQELEHRIKHCREVLTTIAQGGDGPGSGWFKIHLRKLSPDVIDHLQFWSPPDELEVTYSPRGDGRGFRSLEQGSPGQKTAAILAFVLAYRTEPIILDQPEDDLDNELIYELIVPQLRANKRRRQVMIVTHNPNIVVNGDSENILVMDAREGQCRLVNHGSLQSREIRAQVCTLMEGGREALEKRYRRILIGDSVV